MQLFVLVVALALLATANAAYCNGVPADGERTNDFPIIDGEMTFIKSVKNGQLFETGPANARFPVVHVYGTPYEMGQAQAMLVGEQLTKFVHGTFEYIESSIVESMDKYDIPDALKQIIVAKGINFALDLTARVTAPFTPQSYFDELKGISDTLPDVDYELLLRLQMFPEVTKASCSFFGSWGEASLDGTTYHMRSLDYDVDGPFKDHPQLTVYHPSDGSNAFANMGWPGSIGTLTGMNEKQMGVNEIGVSFPDDSFGQGTADTPPEKLMGKPWMFVVRDVLQHTSTLEEGVESVQNVNRTCNLVVGVGDGKVDSSPSADNFKTPKVNGIEYSGRVAIPYDDVNQLPVNATWHPQLDSMVYNGMDWLCPGYTQKLGEQLTKFRTKIAPANVVGNILPTVQTGNLHIALYDLTASQMYVSFCRSSTADPSEPMYAYERQFTSLDMNAVFNLPAPTQPTEEPTEIAA